MKLSPKTLTGALHTQNKGACDWGWQGLIAYGCQTAVIVVDPKTMQVIQSLDRHKGYVTKIKWSRENYHHDMANPYWLRLASADFNGRIIVWDVAQASIKAEFSDSSKPVTDLEWLTWQDASHDLLAALHPPHTLILWNADTGTKLWKKSYTHTLMAFAFDPFDPNKLAFLGQDCIVFVDDFTVNKCPSSNGKKFYISNQASQGSAESNKSADAKKSTSKSNLTRRVSSFLVGETSKKEKSTDCIYDSLQLAYHQACRNHLILFYPREILVLDLDINQTVAIIPVDRSGSPFLQVLPQRQRDVLLCLHDNGVISVRVRRRIDLPLPTTAAVELANIAGASTDDTQPSVLEMAYDLRCQSDALRITRNQRVVSAASCPVSEKYVALVMSDGKLLLWELTTVEFTQDSMGSQLSGAQLSPLYTPGGGGCSLAPRGAQPSLPKLSLSDMIGRTQSFVLESQLSATRHGVLLKFILTGLLSGLTSPPFVIRMCPPLTTKNWNLYQPLIAIGTSGGVIQVYNLSSGQLVRELAVHTCTVRGIEWVSLNSFMSFAYAIPSSGNTSAVKNELVLTDILTGRTTSMRTGQEETPLEMLKVSYLKQYFVLVFKDRPFELWDLRTNTLLRQMPRNFPHVTALEWSPTHNLKSLRKKLATESNSAVIVPVEPLASSASVSGVDSTSSPSTQVVLQNVSVKEHFVFTDGEGYLYHFIVEGNLIKDGSRIPPDGGMGMITNIAWKADTLVLGDVDGNLNLWDLKGRFSRAIPTHRGYVRKIKFAPGRGNMKLLVMYQDGADIWDAKEVELQSAIKCPKDIAKVTDIDWAASDKPVLACADGCVRVMDIKFKDSCGPMEELMLADPILIPHLLAPRAALTLKHLIQHQAWRDSYRLDLELTEYNADVQSIVCEQLRLLDRDLQAFLPNAPFGTAQRCLLVARLFGDESEVSFWTVALHYLRQEKAEPMSKHASPIVSKSSSGDMFVPTTPQAETHDLVTFEDKEVKVSWAHVKDKPLETCFDVLCDGSSFQKYELDRVLLHDNKRVTYAHTKKVAETLMMLGQADRVVQLLLETDPSNEHYYVDSLRACLVASVRSSGASQSTMKLVATNLIASGRLWEGVQLLCLIEKGLDACRYLQTYGQWTAAAWLAKATLKFAECAEVMKRWADHLNTINQKSQAVLVMLSLGNFVRVIEMLYSLRHFDRATLFIESCEEFELLDLSAEIASLKEAVFLEYARQLLAMGSRPAAEHYCKRAGPKGEQLMRDVNSLMGQ